MKWSASDHWDAAADVVAIGAGIGGLSAAITADELGLEAIVLERSASVGGVTAISFGEMWVAGNHLAEAAGISDSVDAGFAYMQRLSAGFGDPAAMRTMAQFSPVALKFFEDRAGLRMRLIDDFADYFWPQFGDSRPVGRFLEAEPIEGASLGEWQSRTRLSPLVPHGLTHADMFGAGGVASFLRWDYRLMARRLQNDERCLGPALAAYFVKAAVDRAIPMTTGVDVQHLVTDDEGRVFGVAARRDGADYFVRAHKAVVIATSGYDGNPQFERNLSQQCDVESLIWPEVDGAHLRLAGRLGAQVARVPDVSMLGYSIPGDSFEGRPLWRNALTEMGLPHALVVNGKGRRFGDESFYRSLGFAVDHVDGRDQTQPNFPCWIILDSQAREKYIFGSLLPGQPMPEGLAIKADTLEALALATGIDAGGLCDEVARFNGFCETGIDADFGRGEKPWANYLCGDRRNHPNPNLGPVSQGPFHAIRLSRVSGGGISAAGIVIDEHARAIDFDGRPIPGLYVAGNSAARLDQGAGMQSGFSNTRGMTHGYLAGCHAANASPVDLARQDNHELA